MPITGGSKVSGSSNLSSGSQETWAGTDLYFAHEVKNFKTIMETIRSSDVALGENTSQIGSCSFTLLTADIPRSIWGGNLNCLGDIGLPTQLESNFNSYTGITHEGVTYALTVRPISTGLFEVEINKFTVSDDS